MHRLNQRKDKGPLHSMRGSLLMFAFGLSILAFLIAVEHPEWFAPHLAPGMAAASAERPAGPSVGRAVR